MYLISISGNALSVLVPIQEDGFCCPLKFKLSAFDTLVILCVCVSIVNFNSDVEHCIELNAFQELILLSHFIFNVKTYNALPFHVCVVVTLVLVFGDNHGASNSRNCRLDHT